jgi:hypothetical protein
MPDFGSMWLYVTLMGAVPNQSAEYSLPQRTLEYYLRGRSNAERCTESRIYLGRLFFARMCSFHSTLGVKLQRMIFGVVDQSAYSAQTTIKLADEKG